MLRMGRKGRVNGAPRKYKNVSVMIDGHKFASQREGARYRQLTLMQRAGSISGLRLQVPFELAPAVVLDGRKKPALRYVADFVYFDEHGRRIIEDAKGMKTREYRIKRHLMKTVLGLDIVEV